MRSDVKVEHTNGNNDVEDEWKSNRKRMTVVKRSGLLGISGKMDKLR